MPPVHQHRQPDGAGTPVVDECIHRRADGAAREEHIVDEDDHATVDGERDVRLAHDRRVSDSSQVVAIERDVDRAEWNVEPLVRPDRGLDAGRERVSARANTDDGEKREVTVALDDLVRDPRDGPADVVRTEQRGRLALLPGLTGPVVKGGGALAKYRFDETALRWVGTVSAVRLAAVRIILAILCVALFGAVAVTASGSGREVARATPSPRHTAIPVVETIPRDVGERGARTYMRLWGRFALPIEGGDIPADLELLPGAARDYRSGLHEGIDFPTVNGTPVLAAASGTVARVDVSFLDWNREQQEIALYEALTLGYTPAATLDRIRGRQVWIDHGKGVMTRYAHLSAVEPLVVGQTVEAGVLIGTVGSSGYPQGGPHLHFEVRVGDGFYGDGLSGDLLVRAVSRLFA